MTRTRSEYRLSPVMTRSPSAVLVTRPVVDADRDVLAALMLDAYQGTIDDEGEDSITDGNTASERLFLGLGFTRQGAWG